MAKKQSPTPEADALLAILKFMNETYPDIVDLTVDKGPDGSFRLEMSRKSQEAPQWVTICGYLAGLLTLVFFMYITINPLAPSSIPISVVVLGLGTGLSFSFIGGKAAMDGRIPFPFVKDHPIAVSAAGGIAAMLISMLIFWAILRDMGSA